MTGRRTPMIDVAADEPNDPFAWTNALGTQDFFSGDAALRSGQSRPVAGVSDMGRWVSQVAAPLISNLDGYNPGGVSDVMNGWYNHVDEANRDATEMDRLRERLTMQGQFDLALSERKVALARKQQQEAADQANKLFRGSVETPGANAGASANPYADVPNDVMNEAIATYAGGDAPGAYGVINKWRQGQQKSGDKVYSVDGALVQVNPDGTATPIYQSQGNGLKPPTGYRYKDNGDLEPIPGGPMAVPKISSQQANQDREIAIAKVQLDKALEDYKALVSGSFDPKSKTWTGGTGMVVMPGKNRDAVDQSRTNLQMALKKLNELGAVTGPDMQILNNLIFDPSVHDVSSFFNLINQPPGNSVEERAAASVDRLKGMVRDMLDARRKVGPSHIAPDLPSAGKAAAISQMSAEDLAAMDRSSMTDEELQAAAARWEELTNGQ